MYKKYIKRLLDILISSCALIILSPIMLVVAILVKIKLGSPVIFKQERPGLNEKIFTLYKFRTMSNKKDKDGKLLSDEDRITKFGKILRSTSLDELPELINILKGDMSLIGPRPLLTMYLPYYTEKEKHRHDVRPGLTGYAQINGRNALAWDKRFELDIEYVENISFINDFKIILKTIKKVIKREDVLTGNEMILQYLNEERKEKIIRLSNQDIKENEELIKNSIKKFIDDGTHNEDLDSLTEKIYINMSIHTNDNDSIVLGLYILNELNGIIVGDRIENTISVRDIYTSPKCRKHNFGTKLVEELEKY